MSPIWIIEARATEADDWEIVTAEFDMPMAQVVQEILEEDGVAAVRARELADLPPEEQQAITKRWEARTVEDMDRWEAKGYRWQAIARLHREGR